MILSYRIDQFDFGGVGFVVKMLVVKPLTKKLNRWLGTEFFLLRQIYIIDKNDVLLSHRWSEYAFASPVNITLVNTYKRSNIITIAFSNSSNTTI